MLVDLARRYWPHLALALALSLAWHFQHRAAANAEAMRTQAVTFRQAQIEAQARAFEAKRQTEARYAAEAERTNREYQTELADARSAADRYIASHRVRAEAYQGAGGRTVAGAEDHAASVREAVPADAVMVSAGDVQACSALYPYAVKARDLLLSVGE